MSMQSKSRSKIPPWPSWRNSLYSSGGIKRAPPPPPGRILCPLSLKRAFGCCPLYVFSLPSGKYVERESTSCCFGAPGGGAGTSTPRWFSPLKACLSLLNYSNTLYLNLRASHHTLPAAVLRFDDVSALENCCLEWSSWAHSLSTKMCQVLAARSDPCCHKAKPEWVVFTSDRISNTRLRTSEKSVVSFSLVSPSCLDIL